MDKKNDPKKKAERLEALMRLVVFIVTGIIVWLWGYVSLFLVLVNFIWTLICGKRNQAIAEFNEHWGSTLYAFTRYMSGVSNERPFPFGKIKTLSKFE